MIRAMSKYFADVSPVFLDGLLYVLVAFFGFMNTQLGADEALKHISPISLFWLKTFSGSMSASALALKMYRSTAFADHKQAQRDTAFITRKDE